MDDRRIEREIMEKVRRMRETALTEHRNHLGGVARRMNRAQAVRAAYLQGFLSGVSRAYREFELRQPIEWAEDSQGQIEEDRRADEVDPPG